ncbi:TetR/AcrR family transcriptional regulator [Nocardia goodfellowii]|uniref:AcrR family transcriptional regulator n=1 Tax=Nocardia goodfellowii TaxID=882446 RepID=A0ABS4QKK2_9NOCA|nr:TetR/AcrR family transcriptional regulator [Nocardia goodfellowii]MBP2191186.1 AcrR family transcriptional regulator [Nocardia goodfellowii]
MNARPQRADALRNRQAIVGAARELVISHGPGVGMDQLAAAAGVAVGTLYRHFPTKKDLIEAIVDELSSTIGESLDAALARAELDPGVAVEELIGLLRSVVLDMSQERLFRFAAAEVAEAPFLKLQTRGRAAVDRLVALAHRADALYPDITGDDVILLLASAPAVDVEEPQRLRWLALARRALTPHVGRV